ncbi:MAG: hypothetical protein L0Z55_07920 [Planctomycetes bacterium]|nr:hypothetical protein [Planctomycetota bacterium]
MNPKRSLRLALLVAGSFFATHMSAAAEHSPPTSSEPPALKWSDLLKSGKPFKFYGFLRLDAYYNTARADSVIIPFRVLPESSPQSISGQASYNDNDFALDPRLTRLGLEVDAGEIAGAQVRGRLEVDFANFPSGVSESRATPRIRLAYVDAEQGSFTHRFGQDWDIIAPIFPFVHGELLLWNAGNLGDRRPLVATTYSTTRQEASVFELRLGLGLTGAVDNKDLDATPASPERDGFDSGLPNLQARVGFARKLGKEDVRAGIWAAVAELETDNRIGPAGRRGSRNFLSWVSGVDVHAPLSARLTLRGEAWAGQALSDFRGGIGQSVTTAVTTAGVPPSASDPDVGSEVRAMGGFLEVLWRTTDKFTTAVGYSIDDPNNGDLVATNARRNQVGYIGSKYDWGKGLMSGFDVLYWETDYVFLGVGNMLRFNAWVSLGF